MLTSTFDLTFDQTFQYLQLSPAPVLADPCQTPGVYLMWLTVCGWTGYLFSGNTDTDAQVESGGSFEQARVDQDTIKISRDVLTIRAGSLTEAAMRTLRTLYESPKVFAQAPNRDGQIRLLPVRIEPGTFGVWREASSRFRLEAKLLFPKRSSQRV
ncbi:hypothetical protein [Spirosoma fluminis]